MRYLRFKRTTKQPTLARPGEIILYADEDGSLKTAEVDGEPAPIGDGGSQPITPDAISGLALWYDASQLDGLDDGDPVSVWTDLSGNGHDAEAEDGEEPTYETDVQNGLPALLFDSTVPQYFDVPTAKGVFRQVSGATYVFACTRGYRVTENDDGSGAVVWFSDGDGGGLIRASAYTYNCYLSTADPEDGNVQFVDLGDFGWPYGFLVVGATLDITSKVNRYAIPSWLKSVIGSGTPATAATTPDTDSDNVCVGAAQTEHLGFEGHIGEVAVWPRVVTPDELKGLVAYMTQKWQPITP